MAKLFFNTVLLISMLMLVQCNNVATQQNHSVNTKLAADTLLANDTISSSTKTATQSEITCPKCGHKKIEPLPTDVCLIKYNCEKCHATLFPKDGDCCVFCTYGNHKCPSKQDN